MRIRWQKGTLERDAIEIAIRTRQIRKQIDTTYVGLVEMIQFAGDAAENFLERWVDPPERPGTDEGPWT
jgi:hypothetical protein